MKVTLKIIAYYRVSTYKQKVSGLGLEAQQGEVRRYANGAQIIAEYTEVESGRKVSRPELQKAIQHAQKAKATLVVAKLDRLARDVLFTATLLQSGVEFVACDNPHATKLTIHILAAVAENEAEQISRRTKDALAAAKRRGVKLGSARPGHWDGKKRGWAKAAKRSAQVRRERASMMYSNLLPEIQQLSNSGASLSTIAHHLNSTGHETSQGNPFTPTAVWRLLQRVH